MSQFVRFLISDVMRTSYNMANDRANDRIMEVLEEAYFNLTGQTMPDRMRDEIFDAVRYHR